MGTSEFEEAYEDQPTAHEREEESLGEAILGLIRDAALVFKRRCVTNSRAKRPARSFRHLDCDVKLIPGTIARRT